MQEYSYFGMASILHESRLKHMISQPQFGSQAMTADKQAMPEKGKFDGPAGLDSSGAQNKFAANSSSSLPKPGSSS